MGGHKAFLDTSVLLKGIPEPDAGLERSTANDFVRFLDQNEYQTSVLAITEFRWCVWRIVSAIAKSLTDHDRGVDRHRFAQELARHFPWSLDSVEEAAQKILTYVDGRLRNATFDASAGDWLEKQYWYLVSYPLCLIEECKKQSAFNYPNGTDLFGRCNPTNPVCQQPSLLWRQLGSVGEGGLAKAIQAFQGLPEGDWLASVNELYIESLESDQATSSETLSAVKDCADALGDLLIALEVEAGYQIFSDDAAFGPLCDLAELRRAGIEPRYWRAHDTRQDGHREPAKVEAGGGVHEGVLVNFDKRVARVDSDHPIAEAGDAVHLSAGRLGRSLPAKVLWHEMQGANHLHGLRLGSWS